ncbi:MAG TPA: aminoglycoside phosphotransferase family protein [Nocardioides sp.]|jgi:aminoglycoside phosphotransferase (APT) family kinase protein|nr:aminoglycoside phosphotransferase family protein [Nocardioides sp.]
MTDPASTFTKRREAATPGSIPDVLEMFTREVRFYRELAPYVGVRVPVCYLAEEQDGATHLELEDLSSWRPGADPDPAARTLRALHALWEGSAGRRWPWLPRPDVSDLVGDLYDQTWSSARDRPELTDAVRDLGDSLVGHVTEAERRADACGPPTLTHGDASALNMRTSPDGQVALLDWEDYGVGPGIADLAWHLVSSVAPADWDLALAAYGDTSGLADALPAVAVQGLLSFAFDEGRDDAREWVAGLEEAARRM